MIAKGTMIAKGKEHDPRFWMVMCGFGFYLAWMMIGITPSFAADANRSVIAYINNVDLLGRGTGLFFAILLAVWAYGDRDQRHMKLVAGAVGSLVCLSTVATYAFVALGIEALGTNDISWMPVSLSQMFVILWASSLCGLNDSKALSCVAGAHAIGFVLTFLFCLLPAIAQFLLHASAPLASAWFLMKVKNGVGPELKAEGSLPREREAMPVPLAFFGIGSFGFIMQFLFQFTEGKTDAPDEALWLVAGLCVCVVLVVVKSIYRREMDLSMFSRWILPIFVFGEFLIFYFEADQRPVEVFVIGCAWVYFRIFYFLVWRSEARASKYPDVCVVVAGYVILTLGCVIGSVLYGLVGSLISDFVALAIVCILAILASLLFFGPQRAPKGEPPHALFDPADSVLCKHCVDRAAALYGLTERECIVAMKIVQGYDNDQIVGELVIATNTLRSHLRNVYKKTGTHTRKELRLLLQSLA